MIRNFSSFAPHSYYQTTNLQKFLNLFKKIFRSPSLDLHYPTADLRTPLTIAIDRGHVDILALLIEKITPNLNSTTTQPCGKSALMHASYFSPNTEILQILLNKGADVNEKDMSVFIILTLVKIIRY